MTLHGMTSDGWKTICSKVWEINIKSDFDAESGIKDKK